MAREKMGKRFMRFLIGILYLIIAVDSLANDLLSMPKELENVYLGMSLTELEKVRPTVKKDDLAYKIQTRFETNLDNPFFPYVAYDFSDNKLSKIILSEDGEPDFIQSRILGVIKGGIKKWGKEYIRKTRRVVVNDTTKEQRFFPVFYWEKPQAKIMMTYIITSKEKKNSHYKLVIFDPKFRLDEIQKFKEPQEPNEIEDAFKDVGIAESYEGPIFE